MIFKQKDAISYDLKIDNLDLDILEHLQDEGRLSFRELGRRLKVPHTTVFTRVERLKKRGIIKKFSAIILPHENCGQLGIIIVSPPPSESKNVAEAVSKFDEAKKVFRTLDGKVVIKAIVTGDANQNGLEEFLTKLNGHPMEVYAANDVIKYDHSIHREILEGLK